MQKAIDLFILQKLIQQSDGFSLFSHPPTITNYRHAQMKNHAMLNLPECTMCSLCSVAFPLYTIHRQTGLSQQRNLAFAWLRVAECKPAERAE